MKKLGKYFEQYKKTGLLAPVFKMLEALMNLLVPLVVADVIDQGIAKNQMGVINRDFVWLLALALAGMAFSVTAQYLAARASVGFATNVRQALFDHVLSLSYSEYDSLGSDTMITRMTSDVNQVQNGLNLALRLLLRSPFIVFGSVIMAFTVDVKSALIFLIAVPLLSVVVFGIMLASIPLFRKVQKKLDHLTAITRENLSGVRVIRAFCREEDEVQKFDDDNEALTRVNLVVGRLSAALNPVTYLMVNVATILLIRTGALRVSGGDLMQGELVALYNYMAQIIIELIKLANLIININKSIACADRIAEILDVKPTLTYPAQEAPADAGNGPAADHFRGADSTPAVEFRDVTFSYVPGADPAISNISFTAKRGQTIGIIGGTGSGKSTIANLIARFYDVGEGSVLVDGRDVREYPQGVLTEKIGVVPQKAMLFEGTIAENLRWGNPDATDEDLWKAIGTAQATEVVRGKHGELDALVEQSGRNLSGGQKQRLTIARALVKQPEILIMDDSSSALDYATDLALRRAVRGLEDRMTVFIISQRTSSIRTADQILVLADGELAGTGTHESLMRDCEVYQEIYYSQYPDERPGAQAESGVKLA